ncbi:MAG TPA: hypothetical protein VGQ67_10955 [Candidatus Polarisedimenticolia bacterium]|nr:hypothetical protein [Candidatus Polarisedimenticolia bacterium]
MDQSVRVNRRRAATAGILLAAGAFACAGLACATASPGPTLACEIQTLRMPLRIDGNGTASFAAFPPLTGRLDLAPILAAEKMPAEPLAAQAMLHFGRLYLVADGFRSIWEITPSPGSASAAYRPIPIPGHAAPARFKEVRLSRYGSPDASCLRLDRAGGKPIFITPGGEARDACP